MSNSQFHGKKFENLILEKLGISGDTEKSAIFDIPLVSSTKCAGSVKTASNSESPTICLSDATRVWSWPSLINSVSRPSDKEPTVRLIVGLYKQENDEKVIAEIADIRLVLNAEVLKKLYGSITVEEVYAFHTGLRREFFPNHDEAREWAKQTKDFLEPKFGCIQLNPKIDSKGQRRLQASVALSWLIESAQPHVDLASKNPLSIFKSLIGLRIESGTRQRNRKNCSSAMP